MIVANSFWGIKPLFYWASYDVELFCPNAIQMDIGELVEERKLIQSRAIWHGTKIDESRLLSLITPEYDSIYVYSFAYDNELQQLLLDCTGTVSDVY